MGFKKVSDDELHEDINAFYANSGNKSEAARARGLRRKTYSDRLTMAQQRFGLKLGKVADGRIEMAGSTKRKLPRKGCIKRYILTSIQNNTHLHPGFKNLEALVKYLDRQRASSCELIIGTYSYQLAAYGPKAVKRGKALDNVDKELWYAPEAEPYIIDESVEIAPGLVWCGEQNILPTTKHPLTSFEDYNGRKSNIVPHAKIALESVASMADEATKFNFSTGTITQRNYIQKRAGILAEQKHTYGASLVEVDSDGSWWVRQLEIDDDDSIMDVGPKGTKGIHVKDGKVTKQEVTACIYWGDAHSSDLDPWIRKLAWGKGGMLDSLRPTYQFMGDIFSMNSRSHHEAKNFLQRYAKHRAGAEVVEEEIQLTADFANEANREWCEMVVVPSNHDTHLSVWLNEADFRQDPINAKYFCELQWEVLDAIDREDRDFSILEWAMCRAGLNKDIRFLSIDESFIVEGVECGLHGHLGINGSRGSTRGLTKLGRRINKGHDHSAAIRDGVYSAGSCSDSYSYTRGPSSRSISHIATYKNGKRSIITMWSHKWRA